MEKNIQKISTAITVEFNLDISNKRHLVERYCNEVLGGKIYECDPGGHYDLTLEYGDGNVLQVGARTKDEAYSDLYKEIATELMREIVQDMKNSMIDYAGFVKALDGKLKVTGLLEKKREKQKGSLLGQLQRKI